MELTAVLIFATTTALICGCIAIAGRQAWKVSPTPLEVKLPIAEAFIKIQNKVKERSVQPPSWSLQSVEENSYIIADLDYRFARTACSGTVHFDFIEAGTNKTKIRWICQSEQAMSKSEITSIQGYISDWIQLILFPPPPPPPPQTEWSNKLVTLKPLEYCFSKLAERLSSSNDAAHQWELLEVEENAKISATLKHIELHNKQIRCSAKVVFQFAEDGKETNLGWTYQITQAKNDRESDSLRYITDEWIKLIFL